MNLVWTIFLALVASPEGHPVPPGRAVAPGASAWSSRPVETSAMRPRTFTRRSWHRPAPWDGSLGSLEEFDTEEVDETWLVQLDVLATVPGSWLGLAWSRSRSESSPATRIESPPMIPFPLRC